MRLKHLTWFAAFFGGLLFFHSVHLSSATCFPAYSSLDTIETLNLDSSHNFSHKLKSWNAAGFFDTPATLEGKLEGPTLSLSIRFKATGVSLPYNIHAILVATQREVLSWQDMTEGCTAPGVSVFPQQAYDLEAVKIDGSGTAHLHLIVWGRL